MNKNPRFFCDNCGTEVGSEIKACPYCGRVFASVRCPSCGFSGPDNIFENGCPNCGYSSSKTKTPKIIKAKPQVKEPPKPEPLPFWTYIAAFLTFFGIIALLSYFILR